MGVDLIAVLIRRIPVYCHINKAAALLQIRILIGIMKKQGRYLNRNKYDIFIGRRYCFADMHSRCDNFVFFLKAKRNGFYAEKLMRSCFAEKDLS